MTEAIAITVVPVRIKRRFCELNSTRKMYSLRARSKRQTTNIMTYFFFIEIVLSSVFLTMDVFTTNQIYKLCIAVQAKIDGLTRAVVECLKSVDGKITV